MYQLDEIIALEKKGFLLVPLPSPENEEIQFSECRMSVHYHDNPMAYISKIGSLFFQHKLIKEYLLKVLENLDEKNLMGYIEKQTQQVVTLNSFTEFSDVIFKNNNDYLFTSWQMLLLNKFMKFLQK